MKFSDIINESLSHKNEDSPDLNTNQLKDLKRAKTIFKAFKSGKVKFELTGFGEQILKYEIGNPYYYWDHISPNDIKIELNNITVHTTDPNLYQEWLNLDSKKQYSKSIRGIIEESVIKPNIRKRFKKFNLDVIGIEYFKIVLDEPHPINEDDRQTKRINSIYKAFRTGEIKVHDKGEDKEPALYSYELSKDMSVIVTGMGSVFITPATVKVKSLNKECNNISPEVTSGYIERALKKKFLDLFDIRIRLDNFYYTDDLEPYNEPEKLNEDSTDKERKRVRAIHKALRKGIVEVDGNRFKYELPEDYTFHMVSDQLNLTSIKFTFYNEDINGENAGLNLPLKVWRIEDGKDEYVNEILSKQDVSEICYGDPYLLNTRSGVSYENVKNKVKSKYRSFNVNSIMTTVTDEGMVNESHEDKINKQIRKGKTVYKALKKGTIGGDNPQEPHFKYELPDDFTVDINNAGIIISLDKIKIKHLNRGCLLHSSDYMGNLIRKKFYLFGIVLTNSYKDRYFTYEVEPWESPINEAVRYTEEDITDKDRKRAKLIYKTFKVGIIPSDNDKDIKYRYTLPDEYYISIDDETGDIIIALTIHPEKQLKITALFDTGTRFEREMDVDAGYDHLYRHMKRKIQDKFESFNIQIVF